VTDSRGRVYRRKPGRAPVDPGRAQIVNLKIRISPAERRELERVARENHCTITQLIRDAVNAYVADYGEGPVML
jgi:hypothetical protein